MFFTLFELFNVVLVSAVVAYIFMDSYKDIIHNSSYGFDWKAFRFAMLVSAPAIILHEFGHKFVALAFGMFAQFNASYFGLLIGLALKFAGIGLFFIPGYVRWGCATLACMSAPAWVGGLIAFAGPGVNLLMWLGAHYSIKHKVFHKRHHAALFLTAHINRFLFFFNLLPIPPFDGYSVLFNGIFKIF
jgi:Zn-dependent protease